MARKSKPWAVLVFVPEGPERTLHSSEAKAYEQVRAERAAIDRGESDATAIRVEQWEAAYDRWVLFDKPYPEES